MMYKMGTSHIAPYTPPASPSFALLPPTKRSSPFVVLGFDSLFRQHFWMHPFGWAPTSRTYASMPHRDEEIIAEWRDAPPFWANQSVPHRDEDIIAEWRDALPFWANESMPHRAEEGALQDPDKEDSGRDLSADNCEDLREASHVDAACLDEVSLQDSGMEEALTGAGNPEDRRRRRLGDVPRRSLSLFGRPSEASLADAAFWCGDDVLAPDAMLPQESIRELVNGEATAWNGFDLTLRRLEQIYKRYQHALALPPHARADFLRYHVSNKRGWQGFALHSCACAEPEARARHNPTSEEAEQVFGQILAENGVGVRQAALGAIFASLNAGLKRAGRPLMGSWEHISLAHFALVLRRLKLAQLFRARDVQGATRGMLHTLDYTEIDVDWDHMAWPLPLDQVRNFLFIDRTQAATPGEKIPVRWIHMRGLDPLMLLRLAIKYQLHPLSIEDALLMQKQPSKIERFGSSYFCAINLLQLLCDGHPGEAQSVSLQCSFLSMFVFSACNYVHGTKESCDTIVTVFEDESDLGLMMDTYKEPCARRFRHQKRFTTKFSKPPVPRGGGRGVEGGGGGEGDGGGRPDEGGAPEVRDILEAIKEELILPSSTRLREHGAEFIMYTVLDKTVDELAPICDAFFERLKLFQAEADENPASLRDRLKEVGQVKLDAKEVYRTIRPLQGILKVLLSDKRSLEAVAYLRDVQDCLHQAVEDVNEIIELCAHLSELWKVYEDRKSNRTLSILTVVTTTLLPIQLFSGIYGMNFVTADGLPAIPELVLPNGYTYFWCLSLALAFLTCLVLQFVMLR